MRENERERETEVWVRAYQRSRTADNAALVIVLGAMAWAEELVLGSIPRHNTP